MDLAVLESEALKLPAQERALLVDHLQQSLSSSQIPHLSDHLAESRERYAAYQADEANALEGRTALKELRAKFSK